MYVQLVQMVINLMQVGHRVKIAQMYKQVQAGYVISRVVMVINLMQHGLSV